jgi:Tfp pilus assembly protein PilO
MSSLKLSDVSRQTQILVVCAGILVLALLGYFALISPKRSQAAELRTEAAAVQAQLDRNRSSGFARALPAVKSATVYRLAQAMPDDIAMANVILELNHLAVASGISFDEITPGQPAADTAYDVHPINVVFTGNFYNLSDFLLRVRNLVRVHNGKLFSKGRMFAVSGVTFAEAEAKFPYITANLTVDAFVLGSGTALPGAASTGASTTASTQSTTTPAPAQPANASATSSKGAGS